jgi:hypothetical protein
MGRSTFRSFLKRGFLCSIEVQGQEFEKKFLKVPEIQIYLIKRLSFLKAPTATSDRMPGGGHGADWMRNL